MNYPRASSAEAPAANYSIGTTVTEACLGLGPMLPADRSGHARVGGDARIRLMDGRGMGACSHGLED